MTALERWTEHESAYCESGLCEWSTLRHITALREVVAELRTAGLQLAADSATESAMKDAEIERLRAALEWVRDDTELWDAPVVLKALEGGNGA